MIVDCAVIGGGISGLAAAYELTRRGRSVTVIERSAKAGGVIQTERTGDYVVDAGPDALLVQKPAALELCNELGIASRLASTKPPRTAFILRKGRLHALPSASILGFPTRLTPLLTSTLFSARAKLRMAGEVFIPKRNTTEDESIASFVGRRFGREAVTSVAEPLLAGIHAGDVERLSMRSLFPRLTEAEAKYGSVIMAFRREHSRPSADGMFRSFPNGLVELVDALVRVLPSGCVRYDANVTGIVEGSPMRIAVEGQPAVTARSAILAIPAYAAANLLQPLDWELATACSAIRYLSTATVVFAFPRESVHHPLQGTGFVVPRGEGLTITAGAWISSKWSHRAPEDRVLLRAFLGGARDPDLLQRSDQELSAAALADLTRTLDIRGAPTFTRVYRWHQASPQQEVGHAELMKRIDARLAAHPTLFVSAAGFRGVGIPDCIADARATATAVAERIVR